MYEQPTQKLKINWLELFIKFAILIFVVFIIIWLKSLFNKPADSNITSNLDVMKDAALNYFSTSRLPKDLNKSTMVTLAYMEDNKLLHTLKTSDDKLCELEKSYARVTKIADDKYTIEVNIMCGNDQKSYVNTFSKNTNIISLNYSK